MIDLSPYAIGPALAGLLTVAVLSYAVGNNALFRLSQHLLIGSATGYLTLIAIDQGIVRRIGHLENPAGGLLDTRIGPAVLLGMLVLVGTLRPLRHLSAPGVGLLLGGAIGMALVGLVSGTLIPQVGAFGRGISSAFALGFDSAALNAIVVAVGTITVTIAFSRLPIESGVIGAVWRATRRIGQIQLLIAFGAAFGLIAAARFSLLSDRMRFLLIDLLGIIPQ